MKKILLVVVLVVAAAVFGRFASQPAPRAELPAALLRIECQKDSLHIASEGYDVGTLVGTTLAFPCVTEGSSKEFQKYWDAEDPSDRYNQTIYFRKSTDGRFEKSDSATGMAWGIPNTLYVAQTTFRSHQGDHWQKPLLQRPGERWLVKVETPSAFNATGMKTTFVCHAWRTRSGVCRTRARSSALYWDVLVSFANPLAQEGAARTADDLAEAYELIAAHIVSQ